MQVYVLLGAFDDPNAPVIRPQWQYGKESMLCYIDDVHKLPLVDTEETVQTRQHPDHDTDTWPPEQA